MNRARTRRAVVRLVGVVLVAGIVRPGLGEPGDVLITDVPVLGGATPKARELDLGDSSVSATGAFEYSYPIVSVPGRLGMEPVVLPEMVL